MKINPEKLAALCALPDAEMWSAIRNVASGHGISLPERCPDAKTMSQIRAAAGSGVKINISEALRIINGYKKGGKQ